MKITLIMLVLSILMYFARTDSYTKDFSQDVKIYTICFTTKNVYAKSYDNILFISTDSGNTWSFNPENFDFKNKIEDVCWSAEIYCFVEKTSDGGKEWDSYPVKNGDSFCNVYLIDPNMGYKKAFEFLSDVTMQIISNIGEGQISTLIRRPQSYTEYYSSQSEGWLVGWYLEGFIIAGSK